MKNKTYLKVKNKTYNGMEQIIVEHFDIFDDYRNFNLIFETEPPFIKDNNEILIFDIVSLRAKRNNYKIEEGIIQNANRQGFNILWNNGWKVKEGNYRNGLEEGLWTTWWSNGQKREEGNYQNGEQEGRKAYSKAGLWSSWYKNGQKRYEGNYRNDEKEGLWVRWNIRGQKIDEINY